MMDRIDWATVHVKQKYFEIEMNFDSSALKIEVQLFLCVLMNNNHSKADPNFFLQKSPIPLPSQSSFKLLQGIIARLDHFVKDFLIFLFIKPVMPNWFLNCEYQFFLQSEISQHVNDVSSMRNDLIKIIPFKTFSPVQIKSFLFSETIEPFKIERGKGQA